MARKRYESPIFTVGLFVLIFLGLLATALDPTGVVASRGETINIKSLAGMNQALLAIGLVLVVAGAIIRLVAIATLKRNFSGAVFVTIRRRKARGPT
jgi:uncharacterized membrane protein